MAAGGLTSIPIQFSHDMAAGGLIAFADGGTTELDPVAEYPKQITMDEARAQRENYEKLYGFGGDPYAEAKRRYTAIEQRQLEREKENDSNRFWAGLAAYGSAGPKGFAQAAGNASKVMQEMQTKQEAEGDANRAKMAELHTLWGKEQDALNRAKLAADQGDVEKKRKELLEAANYRLERQKVAATTTQAEASAKQAATQASKEAFDQANYSKEFALKELEARARNAYYGKLSEVQERIALYNKDPNAYMAIYGNPRGTLTKDQMVDNWTKMNPLEKMRRKQQAGGDILKAEQDYYREQMGGGLAGLPAPAGGKNPYSTKSDAEIKAALGTK
jgi:hypothetical protein